jgi:2-polyprenyl-3-methyl-5-hydroxy-6-metoxy-1,4-benzoquinol methylase
MTPGLLERLMRRFRSHSEGAPVAATLAETNRARDRIVIDLPAELKADYPAEFPIADAVTNRVLAAVHGADLDLLSRRSPSLKGFDWTGYLRCSLCRVVRVQRALSLHVPAAGRVLDLGAYFGNFALAARAMGYRVESIDSYKEYGAALSGAADLQRAEGITVHDFAAVGFDLGRLANHTFDAVICGGVIEHIPHTPRLLLETATRVLKPGGVLVMDTPNLAYLYKRLALIEGRSVFPSISDQYFTEIPFEGHHREYTIDEVEWMLRTAGHEVLAVEVFNYSVFGLTEVTGEDAEYFREMIADRTLREVIMTVSRRRLDA